MGVIIIIPLRQPENNRIAEDSDQLTDSDVRFPRFDPQPFTLYCLYEIPDHNLRTIASHPPI